MPIKATVNSAGKYRVAINTPNRSEVRTVGILPSGQKTNYLSGLDASTSNNPDK